MVKSLEPWVLLTMCLSKYKRVSFKPATHKTKAIIDYIHSDFWGPLRKPSLGDYNFLLTFIDDFQGNFGVTSQNIKMKYLMYSWNKRK